MASREKRNSSGKQVANAKEVEKDIGTPEGKKENQKVNNVGECVKRPRGRPRKNEDLNDAIKEKNRPGVKYDRTRSASLPPAHSPNVIRKFRVRQQNGVKNHVSRYRTRSDNPIKLLRSGKLRTSSQPVFKDNKRPLEYIKRKKGAIAVKDKLSDELALPLSDKTSSPCDTGSEVSVCDSPLTESGKVNCDFYGEVKMPGVCSSGVKTEEPNSQETQSEGDHSEITSDSNLGKSISHKISALIKRAKVSEILHQISIAREKKRSQIIEVDVENQCENNDTKKSIDNKNSKVSGIESDSKIGFASCSASLLKSKLNLSLGEVKCVPTTSHGTTKDILTSNKKHEPMSPSVFYKCDIKETNNEVKGNLKGKALKKPVSTVSGRKPVELEGNKNINSPSQNLNQAMFIPKAIKQELIDGECNDTSGSLETVKNEFTNKNNSDDVSCIEPCISDKKENNSFTQPVDISSNIETCSKKCSVVSEYKSNEKERCLNSEDITTKSKKKVPKSKISNARGQKDITSTVKSEIMNIENTGNILAIKTEPSTGNLDVPSFDTNNQVSGAKSESIPDKSSTKIRRSVRSSAQRCAMALKNITKPRAKLSISTHDHSPTATDDECSISPNSSDNTFENDSVIVAEHVQEEIDNEKELKPTESTERKFDSCSEESEKKYDSNVPIEKKCPNEINKIEEESPDIKTNNEKQDISVTSDIFTVDNRTVSESEVAKVAELVSPKKNVNVPVNNNCELEIKTGKVEVLPEEKSEKEIEASKNWEKNKQREELKDCKENSSSNEKYILPTEKFLNDTTNNMSLGCALEAVEKIQGNQELKKVLAVQKIDEEQERECTIKEIQNLTTALNKQKEELQAFKEIVEENTTHCVILEAQLTEKYNERNVYQQDVNSLQSSSDSRHNRLEEPQQKLISEMNVLTKQKGVLPEEAENVRCNDETNGNDVTERRRIEVNSSRIISLQWVTCNDSQDLITKKRLFASVHMLSVEREMCVALQIKWACRSLKPRPPPRPPPQRDRRVISTPLFTDNGRREELMRQASLI